ncbi:flagellar hook-length control protein FliK [Inediibacterium massiliense]|uniref:flagellar hook-length control protein FliK n=1 Tax=Inediibacterium massiliense TaxID=1658111 RepID=UPI0006B559A2|nr:flagellar hook-length control protein FliK [Inediibacterium massiliense]
MNELNQINLFKVQKYYNTIKKPFDINGTLVEKNKNKVCVDIGNNKIAQMVLKNNIDQKIGDQVSIDKSKIISLRIYDNKTDDSIQNEDLLQKSGIEMSKENLDIAKALDEFNIPVNQSSIESMVASKKYLQTIQQELNHDMAIKLMDKDIDLENDSVEKIAKTIEEIQEEKLSTNIEEKTEMTTEEAEEIAKEIYGSKMGKEITNAIKALHKEKITIDKKNIERIYDIVYKLQKLKEVKDENYVEVYKKGEVISIDNLYHTKEGIQTGRIDSLDERSLIAVKAYGENMNLLSNVEDFSKLQEKLIQYLKELGVAVTTENIKIGELFLKLGVPIEKERIEEFLTIKNSSKVLQSRLNEEMICKVENAGWDVKKHDIRMIHQIIENGQTQNHEWIQYDQMKNLSSSEMIDVFSKVFNTQQILRKIPNMDFYQIAFHMKRNIPFTLNTIQNSYETLNNEKREEISSHEKNAIQKRIENEKTFQSKEFFLKMNMTIKAGEALYANGMILSAVNVKKAIDAYETYTNVRKNLSTSMILDGIKDKIDLQNMTIKEIDEYTKEQMDKQNKEQHSHSSKENTHQLIEGISWMEKEEDKIISLLMKNNMDFSLREMNKISYFLKNQDQMGQQIGEMIKLLEGVDHPILKEYRMKLENLSKSFSQKLKEGVFDEKDYDKFVEDMKSFSENMSFGEDQENLNQNMKKMMEIIKIQKNFKKNNIAIQMPVWMNHECRNLQIYSSQKNIDSNKIPVSTLIQLDTNTLGSIKMELLIKKNTVDVRIHTNQQEKFKNHISFLEDHFKEIGYNLGEVSFIG